MTERSEPTEPALDTIVSERRQLINLAYRLLGSLAEAEDVVQETYARWYAMPAPQRDAIESPGGWLTTVAGRICLDLLGSARARRERYVGEWLPEPVPGRAAWAGGTSGGDGDPAERVTLDESITMAFLVVLETMTPAERVALVLHDVFGYPFAEIAAIVGRTPAACRQLASSGRRRLRSSRTAAAPAAGQAELVRRFARAWRARDIGALIDVLDPAATAIADGGGLVPAHPEPLQGGETIARTYLHIATLVPGLVLVERVVNGRPGLVARVGGETVTVYAFDVADDRISRIWAVRNPEKLRIWTGAQEPEAD